MGYAIVKDSRGGFCVFFYEGERCVDGFGSSIVSSEARRVKHMGHLDAALVSVMLDELKERGLVGM